MNTRTILQMMGLPSGEGCYCCYDHSTKSQRGNDKVFSLSSLRQVRICVVMNQRREDKCKGTPKQTTHQTHNFVEAFHCCYAYKSKQKDKKGGNDTSTLKARASPATGVVHQSSN
mmetsp:Transcript_12018/g.34443  ORF Transcript_12018/g.34443 Transcript_12018/m.34443 type:complete len:115 (-) Transcript_12018:1529-1873(-)